MRGRRTTRFPWEHPRLPHRDQVAGHPWGGLHSLLPGQLQRRSVRHDGVIDRHGPANAIDGIRCREDGGEDLLPGSVDGSSAQPLVNGLKRAELVGEVLPGRVGAVLPCDGLERAAVVGPSSSPDRIGRHQRFEPAPHRISDH